MNKSIYSLDMANRNFDSRVIIQRLQNQTYSRNLYINDTTGQRLINNPQTTDGNSSRYVMYIPGAQTEYARNLGGTTTVSVGGIVNIPPYPTPPIPPVSVPTAPTSLVATPGDSEVSVAFTQGSTGGSPITNYYYSTDNGATFSACSPEVTASPIVITGLTNGTTYQIILRAINHIGLSNLSNAVSATPATVPNAPVITSSVAGNTQATVNFASGVYNGGSVVTNYLYSIDNGATFTAFSPIDTLSPVVITGLTNETSYTIKLKSINAIGTSDASNATTVTPGIVPDAPVIAYTVPDNALATVGFSQGSAGSSPITNYEYSTDNGATFIPFSPVVTASPALITTLSSDGTTPLTNGTTYFIKLKAVNAIGTSNASNAESVTPFTVPDAPTITTITSGNVQLTVAFTQGSDGGDAITNYQYSTDNGANFIAFSPAVTVSPFLITETSGDVSTLSPPTPLVNGTSYTIKLKAVNAAGTSAESNAISATPYTGPDAPTSLAATPGNAQATITFIQGSDGGSAITNYQYSTDDGSTFRAFSPVDDASPVTITKLSSDGTTSLSNGTSYDIRLKAVNDAGVSTESDAVSVTPFAPIILTYSTVGSTTWTAPAGVTSIDYLVVGGGGGSGGGYDTGGGGGGGGGMVLSGTLSVTPSTIYNITVGDGGTAGISNRLALPETDGGNGNSSSFDTIVALGGGGGHASRTLPTNSAGGNAAINPSTASEGGNGGGSAGDANGAGGGGGGSSGIGANGASNVGGTGGSGTVNSISGVALTYGTGGRGANGNSNNAGVAGTSGTGNGARGGGAASFSDNDGAKGGSGVVIISYSPSS